VVSPRVEESCEPTTQKSFPVDFLFPLYHLLKENKTLPPFSSAGPPDAVLGGVLVSSILEFVMLLELITRNLGVLCFWGPPHSRSS